MLVKMEGNSASGGGNELIPATSYGTKSVSYAWDYDAVAIIVMWTFRGTDKDIIYVDLSAPTILARGVFAGTARTNVTFSSVSLTANITSRSATFEHISQGFSDAYVIPLKDKI